MDPSTLCSCTLSLQAVSMAPQAAFCSLSWPTFLRVSFVRIDLFGIGLPRLVAYRYLYCRYLIAHLSVRYHNGVSTVSREGHACGAGGGDGIVGGCAGVRPGVRGGRWWRRWGRCARWEAVGGLLGEVGGEEWSGRLAGGVGWGDGGGG
ncbi:hypothetical protein Tco_1214256 [Tanacetum coccineum]